MTEENQCSDNPQHDLLPLYGIPFLPISETYHFPPILRCAPPALSNHHRIFNCNSFNCNSHFFFEGDSNCNAHHFGQTYNIPLSEVRHMEIQDITDNNAGDVTVGACCSETYLIVRLGNCIASHRIRLPCPLVEIATGPLPHKKFLVVFQLRHPQCVQFFSFLFDTTGKDKVLCEYGQVGLPLTQLSDHSETPTNRMLIVTRFSWSDPKYHHRYLEILTLIQGTRQSIDTSKEMTKSSESHHVVPSQISFDQFTSSLPRNISQFLSHSFGSLLDHDSIYQSIRYRTPVASELGSTLSDVVDHPSDIVADMTCVDVINSPDQESPSNSQAMKNSSSFIEFFDSYLQKKIKRRRRPYDAQLRKKIQTEVAKIGSSENLMTRSSMLNASDLEANEGKVLLSKEKRKPEKKSSKAPDSSSTFSSPDRQIRERKNRNVKETKNEKLRRKDYLSLRKSECCSTNSDTERYERRRRSIKNHSSNQPKNNYISTPEIRQEKREGRKKVTERKRRKRSTDPSEASHRKGTTKRDGKQSSIYYNKNNDEHYKRRDDEYNKTRDQRRHRDPESTRSHYRPFEKNRRKETIYKISLASESSSTSSNSHDELDALRLSTINSHDELDTLRLSTTNSHDELDAVRLSTINSHDELDALRLSTISERTSHASQKSEKFKKKESKEEKSLYSGSISIKQVEQNDRTYRRFHSPIGFKSSSDEKESSSSEMSRNAASYQTGYTKNALGRAPFNEASACSRAPYSPDSTSASAIAIQPVAAYSKPLPFHSWSDQQNDGTTSQLAAPSPLSKPHGRSRR